MNKIYMTKRGHDGKTVVCSEKTRARGKMKSLVAAVSMAVGATGLMSNAQAADVVWESSLSSVQNAVLDKAYNTPDDTFGLTLSTEVLKYHNPADIIKITDAAGAAADLSVTANSTKETSLNATRSNTLALYRPGYTVTLDVPEAKYDENGNYISGVSAYSTTYTTDPSVLVIQDTDNTAEVTSATDFLKVTPKAPVANDATKGIGAHTEYELKLNYNTTQFTDANGELALADSFISTLGGGGDVPNTYFHVNNTSNTGTGDATTNYGTIDSAAGATGAYSVTAGVNTTAASNYSTAIGYQTTAGFLPTEASGVSEQVESIAIGKNATAEATQSIAIGTNATISVRTDTPNVYAIPTRAITIGAESAANGLNSVALGPDALAGENFTIGANTIAIGNSSSAIAQSAVAMGYNSNAAGETSVAIGAGASTAYRSDGSEAVAIGSVANASRARATALGAKARADGADSLAMGSISHAASTSSIAMGTWTQAEGTSAQAIGHRSAAYSDRAMAEGHRAVAVNLNTSASGVRSVAAGVGSIAIGTNAASGATRADADAIIAANDAYTLAMYRDYIAKINLEADPTNATAIAEAQTTAATLESTRKAVDDALAAARANAKSDTIAIGTGAQATHEDAVALGSGSITHEATSENTATVGGVTYGGFAGNAPKSVVSFGQVGQERQLVNVAAGNISATSTDAINGSQLYLVTKGTLDQFPVIFTDADGNKLVKAPDGNFYPADTVLIDGKYYPPGTTPEQVADGTATPATPVDAGNVIASMNDGDNVADSPKTLANVKGNLTPTYNVGDMTINATTGVPSDVASTEYTKSQTGPNATTAAAMYNNAATVGDILNAGWNLQESGQARDFVKPYDTVNFVNGTGTIVNITTNANGTVSDIRVDLNLSALTGTVTNGTTNTNGTTTVNTDQGDKLVNVTTMVDAINNSGWNVIAKAAGGTTSDGNKETLVKPGSTVELIAGKNIDIKQDGQNFTFSTVANPNFTTVTIGDSTGPTTTLKTEAATPATNNNATNAPTTALNITATDGKPTQITGVGSVLNTTTVATNPDADAATAPVDATLVNLGNATNPLSENILNSAATVRDLANMGWVVSAQDGYKDVVKNANEVKFISNSDALTVNGTTTADGVRQISISLDPAKLATASVETTNLTVNNGGSVVAPPTTDGSKLVNATTVVGAINNSGWTTTAVNATTGAIENVVVNPGEAVNYVDGNGTIANVTVSTVDGKDSVSVSFDVDKGNIANKADGSVTGPAAAAEDALTQAKDALAALPADATQAQKDAAQAAVDAAQAAVNKAGNQVATAQNVADAINKSGFTLTAQGANGSLVSPGETVDMKNTDGNINITKSADNNDVVYNMAPDVKIEKSVTAPKVNADAVTIGNVANPSAPSTTLTTVEGGNYNSAGQKIDDTAVPALSVGGNQITNVANGAISPSSTDAINGSQLYALQSNISNQIGDVNNRIDGVEQRIGDVDDMARAGIAGALATAGLPQVYLPGKSLVAVGAGTFKGESGLAVSFSSISDNGSWILKGTGSTNTQGDVGGTVAVGYQW